MTWEGLVTKYHNKRIKAYISVAEAVIQAIFAGKHLKRNFLNEEEILKRTQGRENKRSLKLLWILQWSKINDEPNILYSLNRFIW